MILTSFASGSSGNCTFLSTGQENILVDCGLSLKRIKECLECFSLGVEDLDAVLLTHEHADHIKGLKRLLSGYGIPVYCSAGTWNSLPLVTKDEYYRYAGAEFFREAVPDREFYIGNILVHPFHTYHDTAGPLGFRFGLEQEIYGRDIDVAVLTDCGVYDDYITRQLKELDAVLLEANHDTEMLMNGPYPMFLKRRILSDLGHSSNAGCADLLNRIWSPRMKNVLLAHLSEENNTPETAYQYVSEHFCHPETQLSVAPKESMSEVIRI